MGAPVPAPPPPARKPNPDEHPFAPGTDTVIDCAVTAPVLSAGPIARAHWPTTRSDGEPGWVSVNVVVGVRVTTTEVVAWVAGFVCETVTADPETAVTGPEAAPNCPLPKRLEPGGRVPPPGKVPPGGGPPRNVPDVRRPPKPLPQTPAVGCETDTVVAVIGFPNELLPGDVDEVGFPKALTQEPTVTADALVDTIDRNVVADV